MGARPRVIGKADPDTAQSLVAFVADDVTKAMLDGIASAHWPESVIEVGGLDAAASHLRSAPAPHLLIVDLGDSDDPYADLMGLADSCDPVTNVVTLGKVNDLALYKRFIAAGVADYLVKPVSAEELETALFAAALPATTGAAPVVDTQAEIYVVVGSRGGVGASLVAANGAWIMAQEGDRRVALVDLDVQFGTAALSLDLVPTGGMIEALQNPSRLDSLFMASAMVPKTDNLAVLAAEEELGRDPTYAPEALSRMLTEVRRSFDCVWVDMPRGTFGQVGPVLSQAKRVIVVSDLSLAGMRDTIRLKGFCRAYAALTDVSVVLNRMDRSRQPAMTVAQFERGAEVKVAVQLPEDDKAASAATATGKSLADVAKRSKLVSGLRQVVAEVAGDDKNKTGKKAKKASQTGKGKLGGLLGRGK